MNSIFDDEAPSRTSVIVGMVSSIKVVDYSKTNFVKVVQNHIDAVSKLILQDRHVTYREIEITIGNSETSIQSILHEHFTEKKFVHSGSHTVCQSLKGSCQLPNPTKVLRGRSTFKQMVACLCTLCAKIVFR